MKSTIILSSIFAAFAAASPVNLDARDNDPTIRVEFNYKGKVLAQADIPRNGKHIKIADAYNKESMGGEMYWVTGMTIISGFGSGVCDIFGFEKADVLAGPRELDEAYKPLTTLTTLLKPWDNYYDLAQPRLLRNGYIVCRESLDGYPGRPDPKSKPVKRTKNDPTTIRIELTDSDGKTPMIQADIPIQLNKHAVPTDMNHYFSEEQLARAFGANIVVQVGGGTCFITQGTNAWVLTTLGGDKGKSWADFRDKNVKGGSIACNNLVPDSIVTRKNLPKTIRIRSPPPTIFGRDNGPTVSIEFTSLKKSVAKAEIPRNEAKVKISDAFKDKMAKDVHVTGANIILGKGDGFCDIFPTEQAPIPIARLGVDDVAYDSYFDFPPTLLQDGYITCREAKGNWTGRPYAPPKFARIEFTKDGKPMAQADLALPNYTIGVDSYFLKKDMGEGLHADGVNIVSGEADCQLYPSQDQYTEKEMIAHVSSSSSSSDKNLKKWANFDNRSLVGAYFACS